MTVRATILILCACALMAIGGCTSSSDPDDAAAAGLSSCEASAQQLVDRLDAFIEPYQSMSPDEFLADPELAGLDEFQNDIAELIVDVATNPNDDCTEFDLEREVELALQNYAGEGLLNQYLVGVIRQGLAVERRDIAVSPNDDLLTLLPLLGPGSSITFSEGTFSLDATLLVQSDLLLVGAGRDQTIIESSAESAAVAVLGAGDLVINDLSIRHVGDLPASVLLVVDASLELVRVGLEGGVIDAEGAGGSGLVLTESTDDDGSDVSVTLDDAVIAGNGAAGIAVTGNFAPTVLNSMIEANAQCGICFFDDATGQIQSNTFAGNGVGLQASGSSSPDVSANEFVDNLVAGVLIEDDSATTLVDNRFEGVDIVGLDVQDAASPIVQRNVFGAHAVAISFRGSSTPAASGNVVAGGDVGLLIGGSAAPTVFDNEVNGTEIAGILHGDESAGEFTANTVAPNGGAGIVVEGSAAPLHTEVIVDGGLVGAVFRQDAVARLVRSTFSGQQAGFETSENAAATIESNTFVGSTDVGAILGSTGETVLRNNVFDEPLQIGIQTGGQAEPLIDSNTIQGGDTALLIIEESRPIITNNTITGQNFGLGASGTAAPIIEDNEFRDARAAAMSFEDETSGEVRANTILDAGVVGIRIAGSATPTIRQNRFFAAVAVADDDGAGDDAAGDDDSSGSGAGLLYAETAGGVADDNELFGFVISIQVTDAAAPTLSSNRVDGAGVGGVGILYGGESSGTAEGNLSINQQLGFQLSGTASPALIDNVIENVAAAAVLIQGESTARLEGTTCVGAPAGIVLLEQARPMLGSNNCPVAQ